MKVAANPLVVAVALGLLGPLALADDVESDEPSSRCDTVDGENRLEQTPLFEQVVAPAQVLAQLETAWETVSAEPFDVASGDLHFD
jgi:hypothetical protein